MFYSNMIELDTSHDSVDGGQPRITFSGSCQRRPVVRLIILVLTLLLLYDVTLRIAFHFHVSVRVQIILYYIYIKPNCFFYS